MSHRYRLGLAHCCWLVLLSTAQSPFGACSASHLSSPEPHPKSGVRKGLSSVHKGPGFLCSTWVQDRRPLTQASHVCLPEALGGGQKPPLLCIVFGASIFVNVEEFGYFIEIFMLLTVLNDLPCDWHSVKDVP